MMNYLELVKNGADVTDLRKHLVGGETVAVTIRIPENLRDSAKEEAAMRGTSFSALLRECLIDDLVKKQNAVVGNSRG